MGGPYSPDFVVVNLAFQADSREHLEQNAANFIKDEVGET
jgi:hypothetical protein